MKLNESDLICALATPPGTSAIAVVRVSGCGSWELALKLARDLDRSKIKSHSAYLSSLIDKDYVPFEHALLLFFEEGRSYTGQESVEFFCHGNMAIVDHLIQNLCFFGARLAEPGEFTFRAFMNNRLDLVQAEGVLNLIHADSISQAKSSLRLLSGELSNVISRIESQFLELLAQIEAGIDFATEGIELISNEKLCFLCLEAINTLDSLLDRCSRSQLIKKGIHVALVGEPNAGKSSLFNAILGEERALVTNIAGTTRDVVEGSLLLDGVKFVFSDTAGIRVTSDTVERLGVSKALEVSSRADVVFLVVNPHKQTMNQNDALFNAIKQFKGSLIQPIFTHADLGMINFDLPISNAMTPVWISNLDTHSAHAKVTSLLRNFFSTEELTDQSLLIHTKQQDLLHKAKYSLMTALKEIESGLGHEIVALSLREGLRAVQKVLGKDYDDQILDRIFSEFCIGK